MRDALELNISPRTALIGSLFVAMAAIAIIMKSFGQQSVLFLVYALMVSFALIHGSMRYGVMRMAIFTVLILVISWSYETMSIMTGFPFGHYHYSENFYGPWVGVVPFMIMPAYFAMGYMSWTIGHILLDKRNSAINGWDIIVLPAVASFVMVMWDMCFDPHASTIHGHYVWHEGGTYFGVPFSNYLGWYLCVFTFYFIFSLIINRTSNTKDVTVRNKAFWILPVLLYLTRCIEYVINVFTVESVQITANDGHTWWTGDITNSMLLVALYTMIFVGSYAILRILRSPDLRH